MKSEKKESNILKFKKSRHLNIGIVTFGIIFVYLIATIVMYITAPRVTSYEVRQGSILMDHAYTGLAIREEEIITSTDSGYINYYIEDNSKIKVGTAVYTISTNKLNFESGTAESDITFSKTEMNALSGKIQNFNNHFSKNDFSAVYQLKDDLQHSINEYTSQSKLEQLNQYLNSGNHSNIFMKYAPKDGIIVFSKDGMESITPETVTLEQLSKTDYVKTDFVNNSEITSGDPIYKIVKSDNWQLMFAVNEETAEMLSEKSTVKIRFTKDNQEVRAGFELIDKFGQKIVLMNFNNSMIRYINERYLDIELVIEDETGLKIPKSAETTKDFYVVPASYLTQGGNSSDDGVLVKTIDEDGKEIVEFKNVTVYYQEDDMIYLDPTVFEDGTQLIKMDSDETCSFSEIRSLKGVYCINKGYAVFKQIEILCENDDYYIIVEGNDFGLSNYDHIALDADQINENDVVF